MNNQEFYKKWNNREELKIIVNAIVYRGLQMASDVNAPRDNDEFYFLEDLLAGTSLEDNSRKYISAVECYRDLIRMPDGFIKNVIKKVL